MKRVIIIGLLFLGVCAEVMAQDVDEILQQVARRGMKENLNTEAVNRHITGRLTAWVDVTFDFITLPGPLTSARANLTIEIIRGKPGDSFNDDWEFGLRTDPRTVGWLSDETVIWEGQKNHGDRLVVPIEFMTSRSGTSEFKFSAPHLFDMGVGVRVQWCLGRDGQLMSLLNPDLGPTVPCAGVRSIFFGPDSVNIHQPRLPQADRFTHPFDIRMTITPPFQIGDTSTVRYLLTARESLPDGFDFNFSAMHMRIISLPDRADFSIATDETVELVIEVAPAAVRDVQEISMKCNPDFRGERGGNKNSIQRCSAVFNEDGSLRYVNQGLGNIDKSLLPQSFPEATDSGVKGYRAIFKDKPHPYPELVKKQQ